MMNSILADKKYLDSLSNIEKKKYIQKLKLINLLHSGRARSTADICRILNISAPTSLILTTELIQQGLLEKKTKGASAGGRKPELFSLKNNSFFVLCIQMERFNTAMAILDNNNNNISGNMNLPFLLNREMNSIIRLHEFAAELLKSSGIEQDKLLGVGISMPGLVDSSLGKNFTYMVTANESKTLKEILEEKFGKPVYIENDVKTNAIAESRYGLAIDKKNVLVLLMDWGIGLGIIMDGKLQTGTSGFAGEIGHIPFVNEGELCYCGKRGCLETVASGLALARMAKDGIKSGQLSILNKLSEEEIEQIEPKKIIEAANNGDQYAITILSQVGQNLGKAVATLIQIFNPEMIILSGKITGAQQFICLPITQSINTYCLSSLRESAQIVLSDLGENAGLIGSASIVIENTFEKQIEMISN